ncbi:MAG: response regulator [Gemmatimonadota bacterium]|nr:response regulator [Gemmatimonadota bacterium]
MKRILVVESEKPLREAYAATLRMEGFEVDAVGAGETALIKTREGTYDLVLLDMKMPGMSGVEFLRKFDVGAHPEISVIVFSDSSDRAEMEEAMRLGAARYLMKSSCPPKKMVETVRETLGASES